MKVLDGPFQVTLLIITENIANTQKIYKISCILFLYCVGYIIYDVIYNTT
jgi:hypothetical protein